jgi:hypothetical protein
MPFLTIVTCYLMKFVYRRWILLSSFPYLIVGIMCVVYAASINVDVVVVA